ncbi:TPA: hypothetical protein PXL93_004362 [Yersinia enterocolitica]|nr:hypothetical protein [Yersinia enterocolitica]HDL6901607.1 hypothetical protein [Yersinia enterocolitica]HDL7505324.1 hypothetical protein [Yersinia enterocolitica]
MKELDSFTVERLEKISNSAFYYAGAEMEEIQALARIALAAKRAEPVAYADRKAFENFQNGTATKEWMWAAPDSGLIALYTTPQLNSPEIPDGWKLVPIEPTDAMQVAAAQAIRFDTTNINKLWTGKRVYADMLAAAPEKPV